MSRDKKESFIVTNIVNFLKIQYRMGKVTREQLETLISQTEIQGKVTITQQEFEEIVGE